MSEFEKGRLLGSIEQVAITRAVQEQEEQPKATDGREKPDKPGRSTEPMTDKVNE